MTVRFHTHVFKRSLRIIGSVMLVIVSVMVVSLVVIRAFTIRDVIVDAPGMTITLDPGRFGTNLLLLPTKSLKEELIFSYPLLSDVRFEKKFPSTLIVHLIRRSAFALIQSAGTIYVLDEQGLVLDSTSEISGYPVLAFDVGTLSIGSFLKDARVKGSLSFLRGVGSTLRISRITEYNGQALQARMGNTNIYFPQTSEVSAKADTLQIIMEGFRIKGTLPSVIDLRYEKPIITN